MERYKNHWIARDTGRGIMARFSEKHPHLTSDQAQHASAEEMSDADDFVLDLSNPFDKKGDGSVSVESLEEGSEAEQAAFDVSQVPFERLKSTRFSRLTDLIPTAPERGEFDVNRIRLSPYFFS